MNDADIFNADLLHRKDSGNRSNTAGLIRDIKIQDISLFQQTIVYHINRITVISGTCKHLIQTPRVLVIHKTLNLNQQTNVVIQNIGDILIIFNTDLLPHNWRRRSNTCDITETSGCNRFHIFLLTVQHIDKIYQCRSDNMRQMADSGSDEIVFFTCKDHRDRTQGRDHLCEICQAFQCNFTARSNNIVSILDQTVTGSFESGLLRTGHWMTSDKTGFHSKTFYFFMDNALDTSDICEDRVRTDIVFEIFKIFYIKFYRSTQENIIAAPETLIMFFAYSIDHIAADCCSKCFPILIISKKSVVFMVFSDGLGN